MTVSDFKLRGVPREVMVVLQQESKKMKISVNSLILRLIQQGIGFRAKPKMVQHHDIDFLIGTWSAEEAQAFDATIERL